MASSRPLNETKMTSLSLSTPEIHTLSNYRNLSLLNGLLIGLAISLGFWVFKLYTLSQLPVAVEIFFSGALVSSLLVIFLCLLISWLTGRVSKGWLTILLWLAAGGIITLILGYMPAYGRNLFVWLTDSLFASLYVYALPQRYEWWSFIIAGFVLIFVLFVLAVLQATRLERAYNERKADGKLSTRAFFILLMPALFAGLGAYIMPDHLNSAPRGALVMTHQGIQTVQEFKGDAGELFALSRDTGFNYSALNGVRDQLAGPYELMVGEVDSTGSQVIVTTHFNKGGWINCRVNTAAGRATYLSFCADASRPYTEGFASLITGEPLPENCFDCLPQAEAEWQTWLQERALQFNGVPEFERLAQQGSSVWMRASTSDETYAIDCLFTGISEVQLQECKEVSE